MRSERHSERVFLIVLAAIAAGCGSDECPSGFEVANGTCVPVAVCACREGTITDVDGVTCVPSQTPTVCDQYTFAVLRSDGVLVCISEADPVPPGATVVNPPHGRTGDAEVACCGTNTVYDGSRLACVAKYPPAECADGTEVIEMGDQNSCFGGDPHCNITCRNPVAGTASLCGRIIDAQTNTGVGDFRWAGRRCTGTEPDPQGACGLSIAVFDAAEWLAEPSTATPLSHGELFYAQCGIFDLRDLELPASGRVALVVDDAPNADADTRVTTGTIIEVNEPARFAEITAVSVAIATDQLWTESAAFPFGPTTTLAARGASLHLFSSWFDEPRPGVLVHARSFYFSDNNEERATLAPSLISTGANGSAIVLDGDTTATGGEPAGCDWTSALDQQPLGAFAFYERTPIGATCQ